MNPNSLPLSGIKVLDVTRVLASPFTSYQLSLLGAEIIKIEDPLAGGDPSRQVVPGKQDVSGGMGKSFLSINANKKSVTLNLATPEGQGIFRELARTSDVLIENLRTGKMDGFGLGYAEMSKLNPRLIYCSVTGYGGNGPKADHPAYDPVIQAASGMMSITGFPGSAPVKTGPPVIDFGTGIVGAFAVVTAILQRMRTGEGQRVDVSMLDTAVMLMASAYSGQLSTGSSHGQTGNSFGRGLPANRLFATGDGDLWIGCSQEHQIRLMVDVIGLPDMLCDPRFTTADARIDNCDAFVEEVEKALSAKSAAEWEGMLNSAGVAAMRPRTLREASELPQFEHRNLFHSFDDIPGVNHPLTVPLLAFMMSGVKADIRMPPPRLGEHTAEILTTLGYSPADIASLKSRQVV